MRLLALLFLCRLASAELHWVPHPADSTTPSDAVALEDKTLLCRARLADGNVHPGTTSAGVCRIPQKGTVAEVAVFEIAAGGRPEWVKRDWQSATVTGRQGRSDLYFCRARLPVGSGSSAWSYGKAYRAGPHAGRCYVAFQEREVEVSDNNFELLSIRMQAQPSDWTFYVTSDNCPDYTWGLSEKDTRTAFAELVRASLDEMTRTDSQPPASRHRYNMAVTQEALVFLERYPERKDELIRRVKEGRLFVSPFLNNSLWGFQSLESAIRTMYPARRLEKEWGVRFDAAHHIELPSLPWSMATILAGAGFRWLVVPFLNYDTTFGDLRTPPLFRFQGPDGSEIRVSMDRWPAQRTGYIQGARLLADAQVLDDRLLPPKQRKGVAPRDTPELGIVRNEWIAHYEQLGAEYPVRAILASGTHGDISLKKAGDVPAFADAMIRYNRAAIGPHLVNAILPQFFHVVDEEQARQPFLAAIRGDFGHSWELWPVSLAKYASAMRTSEKDFLAAEALLAVASAQRPAVVAGTRGERQRAEWAWTMLADHAWNGTTMANKQENARLRREWSTELQRAAASLTGQAWQAAGLQPGGDELTLFNPLGHARAGLVRLEALTLKTHRPDLQEVQENGKAVRYFVSPSVPGFGFSSLRLAGKPSVQAKGLLKGSADELDGPFYRVRVDPKSGGLASVVYKPTGRELLVSTDGRTIGQTIFTDDRDHTLSQVRSELVAAGPVLARLKISGAVEGIDVATFVTIYAGLDRVDFDIRIHKPLSEQQQRLVHVFPVAAAGAVERIETTGAIVRPRTQPEGDLVPGADLKRTAVQGFVDVSVPGGGGVTIAPLEAFALRHDLGGITFEALGNDQNYKEVMRNQAGETEFRFRYSLRAHAGEYNAADLLRWSRGTSMPLLVGQGRMTPANLPGIEWDSDRAVSVCLKPGEEDGVILRVWETAGRPEPIRVTVKGYRQVRATDLLERDGTVLPLGDRSVMLPIRPHGFATLRLLR